MAVLKNARHERFCQEVAKGNSAVDAYETAGYKRHDSHAARLVGDGRIRSRIDELKETAAREVEIDLTWWLREVADLYKESRDESDRTNANSAVEKLAKHLGAYEADNTQSRPTVILESALSLAHEEAEKLRTRTLQ